MSRTVVLLFLAMICAVTGNLNPVTTLPLEPGPAQSEPGPENPSPASPANPVTGFIIGDVDTIGGTTYDWLANGPVYRMLCNTPDYGIHVLWMFSASTNTTFPDRNMRYNFYDYTTQSWNWIDPDFMASGINVFTDRSGFGSLDVDPVSGVAVCSRHYGTTPLTPGVAKDMSPGSGLFEYCNGTPNAEGYLWPPIAVDANQTIHCALLDDATRDQLYYSKVQPWCNWHAPLLITGTQPDPMFPDHNIAASKVSQKVCVVWVYSEGTPYNPAYYRISTDGGATWGPATELEPPPAYRGDTIPSFHITSLFPYYDRHDRLHIIVGVAPSVRDTLYIIPAEIWHWCPENSPPWSRIHRAGCRPENLMASVGYNATYACRPSIGEDQFGGLYVAWEQFDSSNVEPSTSLLRADIFFAQDFGNNGQTWHSAVKITDPSTVSHRFPSCIDYISNDTLYITYMIDRIAGFFVQGQGAVTQNPIIVHKIPVVTGIKAEPDQIPAHPRLTILPSPIRDYALLKFALPSPARIKITILDITGREVARILDTKKESGWHTILYNLSHLPGGIYLIRLDTGKERLTGKLLITDR